MKKQDMLTQLETREKEIETFIDGLWLDKHHVKAGAVPELRRLNGIRQFISNLRHSFRFHPEPNHILRKYHREIETLLGKPVSEVI